MGRSEITTAFMTMLCIAFGMGTILLRDYVNNAHEEQMARIEVVRIQEAARMQLPEQMIKPVVPKVVLQKHLRGGMGGPN